MNINWELNIRQALKRARMENKPVMLYFFDTDSIGCEQMEAVTYSNEKVIEFINKKVIPVRMHLDNPLAADFNIQWTPSLVILDQNRREQYRSIGYLSAEELMPSVLLGICSMYSSSNESIMAVGCYEKILIDYPASIAAPEAVFQRAVSLYKRTHDARPLKEAYSHLQVNYPSSPWTKRAFPYRLL